jgi:hypothetical protein
MTQLQVRVVTALRRHAGKRNAVDVSLERVAGDLGDDITVEDVGVALRDLIDGGWTEQVQIHLRHFPNTVRIWQGPHTLYALGLRRLELRTLGGRGQELGRVASAGRARLFRREAQAFEHEADAGGLGELAEDAESAAAFRASKDVDIEGPAEERSQSTRDVAA